MGKITEVICRCKYCGEFTVELEGDEEIKSHDIMGLYVSNGNSSANCWLDYEKRVVCPECHLPNVEVVSKEEKDDWLTHGF